MLTSAEHSLSFLARSHLDPSCKQGLTPTDKYTMDPLNSTRPRRSDTESPASRGLCREALLASTLCGELGTVHPRPAFSALSVPREGDLWGRTSSSNLYPDSGRSGGRGLFPKHLPVGSVPPRRGKISSFRGPFSSIWFQLPVFSALPVWGGRDPCCNQPCGPRSVPTAPPHPAPPSVHCLYY